jgi:hypothetical protein
MGRSKPLGSAARVGAMLVSWLAAATLAQGLFGGSVGHVGPALEQLEERLERKGAAPQPPPQPERSHEDMLEPWELVKV